MTDQPTPPPHLAQGFQQPRPPTRAEKLASIQRTLMAYISQTSQGAFSVMVSMTMAERQRLAGDDWKGDDVDYRKLARDAMTRAVDAASAALDVLQEREPALMKHCDKLAKKILQRQELTESMESAGSVFGNFYL